MDECVIREVDGFVVWLRLARPQAQNALDVATADTLDAHLAQVEADPSTRVVVLTGAGRAFCAGADLGGEQPDLCSRAALKRRAVWATIAARGR